MTGEACSISWSSMRLQILDCHRMQDPARSMHNAALSMWPGAGQPRN